MAKRKGISDRVRFEVFKRDGFRCKYCGATAITCALSLDHVVPHSKGGTDDPANLVTACVSCNGGKSDVPLEENRIAPAADPEAIRAHAAQVREFLSAVRELDQARMEWRAYASEKWLEYVQPRRGPAEGFITIMVNAIANHGAARFHEALEIVERKQLRGQEAEMYFCGIIRKMAEANSEQVADEWRAVVDAKDDEIERAEEQRDKWEALARDLYSKLTRLRGDLESSRGAELGG